MRSGCTPGFGNSSRTKFPRWGAVDRCGAALKTPLSHHVLCAQAVIMEADALSRENALIEGEIHRIRAHIDQLASDKEGTKAEVQRLLAVLREKEARLRQ